MCSERYTILRETGLCSYHRCARRVRWNLIKKLFEVHDVDGEEGCLEVSSLAAPFVWLGENVHYRDLLWGGYTYANVYSIGAKGGQNTLRLHNTCRYSEFNPSLCDYILIDESALFNHSVDSVIETVKQIRSDSKLNGVVIQSGCNEDSFFRFFETRGTTIITYLFSKKFFDEIPDALPKYAVTPGLITHNDVQIAIENGIGIVHCINPDVENVHMIPLDLIRKEGGKAFLSPCKLSIKHLNGFLLGYTAKTLLRYYRKRALLEDNDFLEMLYSWWKEILPLEYPPDSLIFKCKKVNISEKISLETLISLGKPEGFFIDSSQNW